MDKKKVCFNIDGVEVVYTLRMFVGLSPVDHFELQSLNISETGYKSHFAPSDDVKDYKEYAKALIQSLWIESANQMQLF